MICDIDGQRFNKISIMLNIKNIRKQITGPYADKYLKKYFKKGKLHKSLSLEDRNFFEKRWTGLSWGKLPFNQPGFEKEWSMFLNIYFPSIADHQMLQPFDEKTVNDTLYGNLRSAWMIKYASAPVKPKIFVPKIISTNKVFQIYWNEWVRQWFGVSRGPEIDVEDDLWYGALSAVWNRAYIFRDSFADIRSPKVEPEYDLLIECAESVQCCNDYRLNQHYAHGDECSCSECPDYCDCALDKDLRNSYLDEIALKYVGTTYWSKSENSSSTASSSDESDELELCIYEMCTKKHESCNHNWCRDDCSQCDSDEKKDCESDDDSTIPPRKKKVCEQPNEVETVDPKHQCVIEGCSEHKTGYLITCAQHVSCTNCGNIGTTFVRGKTISVILCEECDRQMEFYRKNVTGWIKFITNNNPNSWATTHLYTNKENEGNFIYTFKDKQYKGTSYADVLLKIATYEDIVNIDEELGNDDSDLSFYLISDKHLFTFPGGESIYSVNDSLDSRSIGDNFTLALAIIERMIGGRPVLKN